MRMRGSLAGRVGIGVALLLLSAAVPGRSDDRKVYIGLSAEFGHVTSTSDDAIRQGILIAVDEINRNGGVLGGRPLELVVRDDRAVPSRATINYRELAAKPDLVAAFCGKYSSAVIESLPALHELELPLLDPWAANDRVIENGFQPNFAFRLSLKDSWAVPVMLNHARKRGYRKLGLLLVNTSWGRNNFQVVRRYITANPGITVVDTQWFNYSEKSLMNQYRALRRAGAQAIILVAIEAEGALLVRELGALPPRERLPVISHWSIAGGDFPALTGEALHKVDLVFVQTFDLQTSNSAKARKVVSAAMKLFHLNDVSEIKSPAGLAHAYDLTHILALAIDKTGSTDRRKIRDALEQVERYDGLVRSYRPPFTATRHEALGPENVFLSRFRKDGVIQALR